MNDRPDIWFFDFSGVMAEEGFLFNSYCVGLCKRGTAFFLHALQVCGARAANSVFIDDNPANVQRAKCLGLHAALFTDEAALRREIAPFCPELSL